MKEILLQILTFTYGGIGIISMIAYGSTIRDLYQFKKPSANTASYALWTFTTGTAFLYSLFILPNTLFRIVSGINFCACATVLLLSIRLKNK